MAKKKGYWMIRTIKSGGVIEKTEFFAGVRRPRAARKKGNSTSRKKDSNFFDAKRRLARTINCNFGSGDILLTLTYDPDHYQALLDTGDIYVAANKAAALFWRRLWKKLSGLGIKIKGLWITADKNQETGELVRVHHHLVVNKEGFDLNWEDGELKSIKVGGRDLADIWKQGFIYAEPLKNQDDYTGLAVYLIRQAVGGVDQKKWHASRGLLKPIIEEHVIEHPHELRAPGGASVKEVGHYDIDTGTHYIRYVRRRRAENHSLGGDPYV